MTKRVFRYDNAKFFLMFLVILGHLLECISGNFTSVLYKAIYLFHMPAFIFLSGYFATFNAKRILGRMIIPYLVFQTIYLAFDAVVLEQHTGISLSYTTPYWLLWYLFVIVIYNLLIPFWDTEKPQNQMIVLIASVILSLLAGYDRSIGYFLSLSRLITFAPFFLSGFYLRKHMASYENSNFASSKCIPMIRVTAVIVCVAGIFYCWRVQLPSAALYGSYSYVDGGYSPVQKLLLLIIGCAGIVCMHGISNTQIPIVSEIGKNTFPIYCLHGFAVRLLKKTHFFNHSEPVNLMLAVFLAAIMMLAFGNKVVCRLFATIFGNKK